MLNEEQAPLDLSGLKPAPYIKRPENGGPEEEWVLAISTGDEALRAGKVAFFTVAGGQGTRLGFDGPKGTFPITPVQNNTLFQVFSDKIFNAQERAGVKLHWFIMTSKLNHEETIKFFEGHEYFRLDKDQVHFFSQGLMPALSPDGKILMETMSQISMTPDGHGGALRALVKSGSVAFMEEQGIEALSYFQVDNPLVHVADPAFIGFHLMKESEMSSKMVSKAYAGEKVGHFCLLNDKATVIEYSDMPSELARLKDEEGELLYKAGSVAIHILSRDFIKRVGSGESEDCKLPFHKAFKKIQVVNEDGITVKPEKENGYKMEMFVFDALPMAKNPVILEALRADEFSPVKNASGVDSAETCKDDQLRQWAGWLEAVGYDMILDETGLPMTTFEIRPVFACSKEEFQEKWEKSKPKPIIQEKAVL
jgi:UDP-N-acetylglucosamine/UDP-N-acetylgalactosamine diphosphorylase